jgi:beta-glucosidase/6-phospho-beta-glucosidase/beta-galactosidase
MTAMTPKNKGRKFMWGVATSSYQTEGGITNNDWHYFTTSDPIRKRISNLTAPSIFYKDIRHLQLQPAGDAVRFWESEYYLKDFDNAKNLGLNSFRISLEWARIEPERNQWDQNAIDSYRQMLMSMRDKGLEPIVTLNHLTLPLWVLTPPIQFKKKIYQYLMPNPIRQLPLDDPPSSDPFWKSLRGWENEETIREFVKFVERVVSEFKDLVDYWITISEPIASIIGGGYLAGISPPGFFLDGKRTRAVLHNLIEAHVQAYDKISELDDTDANNDGSPKNAGFSHLMMVVRSPLNSRNSVDVEAAKNFSYFINDYFLNAIMNGEEDVNYLNTLERYNKDSKNFCVYNRWKQKTDFIGLNYYRRLHVRRSQMVRTSNAKFIGGAPVSDLSSSNNFVGRLNDLGWEIYPDGLFEIIRSLKEWNKPIFITENGIADKSDALRPQFIIDHVKQIKHCLDENLDVIGYLHWSLMDNYEWHEGYNQEGKFGLFSVDRKQLGLPRMITMGAKVLSNLINESVLTKTTDGVTDKFISKIEGEQDSK